MGWEIRWIWAVLGFNDSTQIVLSPNFKRGRGTSSRVESKGVLGALQPQSFGNVLTQVEARELPLARSFPILAPNLPSKSHFIS